MFSLLKKIFGSRNDRLIKQYLEELTDEQTLVLDRAERLKRDRFAERPLEGPKTAAVIFDKMSLSEDYPDFLTLPLYEAME